MVLIGGAGCYPMGEKHVSEEEIMETFSFMNM
jgi:hypothetical protein